MTAKPFVYRDADGVRRTMHPVDHDSFVIQTEVDLDPILEGVKRDRELVDRFSDNKVVARVPMFIYEQAIREGWDDDDWKKWLNRSENEPFRVWKGQV